MKPPAQIGRTYLLYARVSPKGSSWDGTETSIPVQLEEMRRYVRRMDPDAAFVEVQDEFRSGKDLKRPGMQRILSDLKRRPVPWDCLVVWNLDRLTRTLSDALPLLTLLRDAGRDFVSINQEYLQYTGAMSRYMMHQTIAVAELERAMTAERVQAKMRYIAEQGKVPYGCVPTGYKRRPGGNNETIVDEEKAPLVRTVFERYAAGKLNFNEIDRLFPGMVGNRQTLYRMLRNKFYVGVLVYGGKEYKSASPALVSQDVFQKCQERLETEQRTKKTYSRSCASVDPDRRKYILSGLVDCQCGRKMTGYSVLKKGVRYHYYKCTSPKCKTAINADVLEKGIMDEICKAFSDPVKLRKAAEQYMVKAHAHRPDAAAALAQLHKDRAAAEDEIRKLTEAFLSGIISDDNKDFFNQRLTDARERLSCINGQIDRQSRPDQHYLDEMIPALMETASALVRKIRNGVATDEEKRNLAMGTVQSIQVKQKNQTSITFQLNLVMSTAKKWLPVQDSNLD